MTTTPPEPPDAGGTPPPPPGYGTPPPPPGYAAPPGYGLPAAPGQWAGPPLASWGDRAVTYLIDYIGPVIVANIVSQASPSLGLLLSLAALAWGLYNAYLNGSTGQSFGRKQTKTRLLREADGQPIGGGMGILRFFLHILDSICLIGFLFPLWDAKRQTFADKILSTVTVKEG
jgi:uncharacterized RDD family membrane protein YckC